MPEISPSRYMVQAGWDSVPHLDDKTKAELLASTPPYLRDARSKGDPAMGAGMIYPISWEEISVKPFAIPSYWPRGYGLDVGWKVTAAVWIAHDREQDVVYAYSEYVGIEKPLPVHAEAIKARGAWQRGAVDPAGHGASQLDGEQVIANYKRSGLNLVNAANAVEAGIQLVWERLVSGRLKIFTTLASLEDERRKYRRELKDNGDAKVVKAHDHGLDALRYAIATMPKIMQVKPAERLGGGRTLIGDRVAGY